MRFIKRASAAALVVFCLSANFVALAIEPNEIIKEQPEKLQTIQKVYVLPKSQNPDVIPKDGFTEDKTEYEFTEIIIEDNSEEAVKDHTETVSIYASYQSKSVITGNVVGVDMHEFNIVPEGKRKAVPQTMRCLIVIKYRVKVIIPETEVFDVDLGTGYHVLHSMCGANIEYVITNVDRESGFAIGSRKMALERIRKSPKHNRIKVDSIVDAKILSVGKAMATISYNGYDMALSQKDILYASIPDLREIMKPGDIRKALVKEYSRADRRLVLSLKEAAPHPFDGVETRHPIGSTRIGTIVGKYMGGIFCRLHDGTTNVLCSYITMEYDGDYNIGDSVEIIIRKYNYEKRTVYGKIVRKMNMLY